jgi:hypothetical protein
MKEDEDGNEEESVITENMLRRIEQASKMIQLNLQEPVILEKDHDHKLFLVRSEKEKNKFYDVDAQMKVCSCADYNFRYSKCKHILAAEFRASSSSRSLK